MRTHSRQWVLNKLLYESGRLQTTMFRLFDKKETDFDLFVEYLINFVKNNQYIINRVKSAHIKKYEKTYIINTLLSVNTVIVSYLHDIVSVSTYKSKTKWQSEIDILSHLRHDLICIEEDDAEDVRIYIHRLVNRFIGTILASIPEDLDVDGLGKINVTLKNLKYYVNAI